MSLTAKEAKDIALRKHQLLYKKFFDENIDTIDKLILKEAEQGITKCQVSTRYCTHMHFLVYPFDEDKNTMIQNVTTYYKGLGFNIIEEDELLVIEWSD